MLQQLRAIHVDLSHSVLLITYFLAAGHDSSLITLQTACNAATVLVYHL